MKNIGLTLFASFLIISCKPAIEEINYSKGEINTDKFIMIGGGHSAGYMDDALYNEGQQNSVANLIAKQLKLVGLHHFNQPLVDPASVGIGLTGLSAMYLNYKTDCKGVTSLSPVRIAAIGDQTIYNDYLHTASSDFGNFSVPGLKLLEVNNQSYALSNLLFARFSSSSNVSVAQDAAAANATFFATFLGLEDVMAFAKSGGTQTLPDPADFENAYALLIQNMTANGAKGVIGIIPDVTEMPYFTTIPWNGLTLDSTNINTVNLFYNQLGYFFTIGSNPFMIEDPSANAIGVRQIKSSEFLLLGLPLDSVKCNQMGVLFPFRDEFVLDSLEIAEMRNKIEQYNAAIRSIADQHNLAVAETGAFFTNLNTGFVYNGVSISAKFVSGGAYSLDGIHLNPRGNALLANVFINAINSKFNSNIPELNAGDYRSILFPN